MIIKKFTEIIAWQKSHEFVLQVYKLSEKFPKSETFGLTSQIRRAAISIPSNIAEGFKRKGKNDSLHFYNISQSSLEEVKYQLLLAQDLKYISFKNYRDLSDLADEIGKTLDGWMKVQK